MTWGDFTQQMNRIVSTFGKQHYADERIKIIWEEVQHFSQEWMKKTADRFIGEHRYAPLLNEFREEISKQREHEWKHDKEKNTKEAEESWDTLFMPDESKENFDFIRATLKGNTTPEQIKNKTQYFEHVAKLAEKKKG